MSNRVFRAVFSVQLILILSLLLLIAKSDQLLACSEEQAQTTDDSVDPASYSSFSASFFSR